MDLRAPIEFSKGAFPQSHNLPLLDDDEREGVGTRYKEQGQDAAIALGHEYVSGQIKRERIEGWREFAQKHPDGYMYCFRGGLRSRLTQQALAQEAGIDYPLIIGGFKSMRRYLIDALERECQTGKYVVITGRTGSGKTLVIQALDSAVDLEGIANHKGSSFGNNLTPQPSQIDFENNLSIALLKLRESAFKVLYAEDESSLIGRCSLPKPFLHTLQQAPLARVVESMESRLDLQIDEYIIDNLQAYERKYAEEALTELENFALGSLSRIRKRLGDERCTQLMAEVKHAFDVQRQTSDPHVHRDWIQQLLEEYYDPMYDYQLAKKSDRDLFQGSRAEVIAWAREHLSGL